MMPLRATLLILFASSFMPAMAKDATGTKSLPAIKTERMVANLGKRCRIAAHILPSRDGGLGGDPKTGYGGIGINPIPKEWRSNLGSVGFQLTCLDAEVVFEKTGEASFDPEDGLWKKDVERRIKSLGYAVSPQEYKKTYRNFDNAIRVYNITAVNAKGFASTEDDTTGDERKRVRHMGFCLINQSKSLCGEGVVGYLADGPKSDLTQRALEIIRTIEFLPDEE